MLVLNTEREIAAEEKIGLFNLIIISESLHLTDIKINEERN